MTPLDNLSIGMNGRFFPANWRPALDEIRFAQAHGFTALQFRGDPHGLTADHLGAEAEAVGAALHAAGITAVMEIVPAINAAGMSRAGLTPLQMLQNNLPTIQALGCRCVHWHLVPLATVTEAEIAQLEADLVPQLAAASQIGCDHGFLFGLEHNEPDFRLFATPEACAQALAAVPDLYFVWDFNHTIPDHRTGFQALIPRMSLLHVADTQLPEVNYHLPLGEGNVDFTAYCTALREGGFSGPAILEIGGLPKSGGYGRDTDGALIASLQRLRDANGV